MAMIAVRVDDLMLGSKVVEMLRSSGHLIAGPAAPDDEIELVVCDLEAIDLDEVGAAEMPAIGFYQHTDVEMKKRAEAAGIDLVIPRSRMARELPDLVERVLAGG
ncbi:MAG: hypothetical protein ACR2K6_06685 [Solirubrobacterales bacterium]